MNSYYIKKSTNEYIYLKLRILTKLECDLKIEKISTILEFLEFSGFIPHLSKIYDDFEHNPSPENIEEEPDIPSLTIDMRKNHKMRFKYWDGSKTYWVYHLDDLYNVIIEGYNEFKQLFDKYKDVTDTIFLIQESEDIIDIRYQYYPEDERDLDILYTYTFSQKIKNNNSENQILKKVYDAIQSLNLQDVNFAIDFNYEETKCSPCEEARRKREENERKNRENKG